MAPPGGPSAARHFQAVHQDRAHRLGTEVVGVAERTGIIAGAVAASVAMKLLEVTDSISGVVTLGDGRLNDRALLDDVIRRGITVFEYIGSGA